MARTNKQKRTKKCKGNKFNKKCRLFRTAINYGPCLHKLLKEKHPKLSISVNSINILNSFGNDILDRIATEAAILAKYNNCKTINSTEIQSAVRLVLPPGLARAATDSGIGAVVKYYLSKKEHSSKTSLGMAEESRNREIWFKCVSKGRNNKIYYWKCKTKESLWEEDSEILLNNPNVHIIDKTNEMLKGKRDFTLDEIGTKFPNEPPTKKLGLHTEQKMKPNVCDNKKAKSAEGETVTKSEDKTATKLLLQTSFKLNIESNDDEDDDEDDPVFKESLEAFYAKSCHSLSGGSECSKKSSSTETRNTSIQDNKMEREAVMLRHNQKNTAVGAESLPDVVPGPSQTSRECRNGQIKNFRIPKCTESNSRPREGFGRGPQTSVKNHPSPLHSPSPPPETNMPAKVPSVAPRKPHRGKHEHKKRPLPVKGKRRSHSSNDQTPQPSTKPVSGDSWIQQVWLSPPPVLGGPPPATPVIAPVQLPPIVTAHGPPLLPTPGPPLLPTPGPPLLPNPGAPLLPTPGPPLRPTLPLKKETVATRAQNQSPILPQNITRRVKIRNSTEGNNTTRRNSAEGNNLIRRNSVGENTTSPFHTPSPPSRTNFTPKVRCHMTPEGDAITNSGTVRVKNESPKQSPSPTLHQNLTRSVRGRNSAEGTTSRESDSIGAKETSGEMKSPPLGLIQGRVGCKVTQENDRTNITMKREQERDSSPFKNPLPVPLQIKRKVIKITSSPEESDNTKDKSFDGTFGITNGTKEKISSFSDDDSDSDDSDGANFKRSRLPSESSTERKFTTSTPARISFDKPLTSTIIRRHSSETTGASSVPFSFDSAGRSSEIGRQSNNVGPTRFSLASTSQSPSTQSNTAGSSRISLNSSAFRQQTPSATLPSRPAADSSNSVGEQSLGTKFTNTTVRSSTSVRQPLETAGPSQAAPAPVRTLLASGTFDARQVLERRRTMQSESTSRPSTSCQNDLTMEWETTEPPQEAQNRHVPHPLIVQQTTINLMNSLTYKPLVVVVDTNVLIRNTDLVDELVAGIILMVPVSVVVPYQVYRELDGMKEHPTQETRAGARAAIRLILDMTRSRDPGQYALEVQNPALHRRKAKPDLELEKNDDFVLNCAVQQRDTYGDSRIVILLTGDKHLLSHAKLMGILSQSPQSFKAWVRVYKENVRLQAMGVAVDDLDGVGALNNCVPPSDTEMEVDPDTQLSSTSMLSLSSGCSPRKRQVPINKHIEFLTDSFTDDLREFLKAVIDKCNERVYGGLKSHASQPRHSWNLVKYLGEVGRRWDTITERRLSPEMRANIRQIIELTKKYNKGKEEFLKSDVKTLFTSIKNLVEEFLGLYYEMANSFLTRINELYEEWETSPQCRESSLASVSDEDDPQPADVALQNIYNCMLSDYGKYKEMAQMESNGEKRQLEDRLRAFLANVSNIRRVLKVPLEDHPQSSLTIDDDWINDFLHKTVAFQAEDGNPLNFELTRENVLALFTQEHLRRRAVELLDKTRLLQCDVSDLLQGLASDDELDFT